MGGEIPCVQLFWNPKAIQTSFCCWFFLLYFCSLAYCQFALCQQPSQRTVLTRSLHGEGTGFDTYCPFLTNLNDCFFSFLWLLECQEVYVLSGDYSFSDVANDVFIVYIFEFFQSYLLVLRQKLTVMNIQAFGKISIYYHTKNRFLKCRIYIRFYFARRCVTFSLFYSKRQTDSCRQI